MSSKGDELYDKRFGERYLVLEAARDSGGELVRIEDTAAPGPSLRPISTHPAERDRFEVLSGTLGPTVDGEQHLLGPGGLVRGGARREASTAQRGRRRAAVHRGDASSGSLRGFPAEITAVNNTEREGLAYLLTAPR